jgi:hypothetical protein
VVSDYPVALALTLAVELPIYVVALRVFLDRRSARAIAISVAIAVAVNLITHPIVWSLLGAASRLRGGYEIALIPVEAGAWLAEAAILWALLRRDPPALLAIAVAANAASFLAGIGCWLASAGVPALG